MADELDRLAALHSAGELSDEEYAEAKHEAIFRHDPGAASAIDHSSEDPTAPLVPGIEDRGSRRRRPWVIAVATAAIVVVVAVAAVVALVMSRGDEGPSVEDRYVQSLRRNDLFGHFTSRANAIAKGRAFCRALRDGAEPQGFPEDQVGVRFFCKKFARGFHVLETIEVEGTFTLMDSDPSEYFPSIVDTALGCEGSGGYSDIGVGTTVTVKSGEGDLLDQSALRTGVGGSTICVFPFSFEVTEGEDQYVVSVANRGELSFTFTDLKTSGVALSLGD